MTRSERSRPRSSSSGCRTRSEERPSHGGGGGGGGGGWGQTRVGVSCGRRRGAAHGARKALGRECNAAACAALSVGLATVCGGRARAARCCTFARKWARQEGVTHAENANKRRMCGESTAIGAYGLSRGGEAEGTAKGGRARVWDARERASKRTVPIHLSYLQVTCYPTRARCVGCARSLCEERSLLALLSL